jgi:hypothetical protein
MKKNIAVTTFFILLFFCIPMFMLAQPPDPCGDTVDPDCPIDSNIYILFLVALFFAAKKALSIKNLSAKKTVL